MPLLYQPKAAMAFLPYGVIPKRASTVASFIMPEKVKEYILSNSAAEYMRVRGEDGKEKGGGESAKNKIERKGGA